MRTISKLAVLTFLSCVSLAVMADEPDEPAQVRSQRALAEYYVCVKSYALKFVKTGAPASEVAEAALSACADSAKTLHSANLAFTHSIDVAEHLATLANDSARRWAIQSLLEARFQVK
jgi:hypothetical protein